MNNLDKQPDITTEFDITSSLADVYQEVSQTSPESHQMAIEVFFIGKHLEELREQKIQTVEEQR